MACIVRMMMRMKRRRRRRLRMNPQGFKLSPEQEHNIFHPSGIFKSFMGLWKLRKESINSNVLNSIFLQPNGVNL